MRLPLESYEGGGLIEFTSVRSVHVAPSLDS